MTNRKPTARPSSYDKKVAAVLQGGGARGALGNYQADAYEAPAASEYLSDWVAGISIGAINAAATIVRSSFISGTGSDSSLGDTDRGRSG